MGKMLNICRRITKLTPGRAGILLVSKEGGMGMQVGIPDAARQLSVSEHTIRRWLRSGQLSGNQMATPQGYTWVVELPNEITKTEADGSHNDNGNGNGNGHSNGDGKAIEVLEELVVTLKVQVKAQSDELDVKNRQIGELHVLIQQAQAALPAPKGFRRWWQFWHK